MGISLQKILNFFLFVKEIKHVVVKHRNNKNSCIKTLKSKGSQALSPEVSIVSEGPFRSVLMHVQAYKDIFTKTVSYLTCCSTVGFSLCFSHTFFIPLWQLYSIVWITVIYSVSSKGMLLTDLPSVSLGVPVGWSRLNITILKDSSVIADLPLSLVFSPRPKVLRLCLLLWSTCGSF